MAGMGPKAAEDLLGGRPEIGWRRVARDVVLRQRLVEDAGETATVAAWADEDATTLYSPDQAKSARVCATGLRRNRQGGYPMIAAQSENIHNCPFCGIAASYEIAGCDLVFAVRDSYPVTPLHTLVLPRRHVPTYFDLTRDEVLAVDELLRKLRADIAAVDASVKGFNIGVNAGAAAGQTIFHCHIHLIPRRHGDVPDPWGGVRAIIPGKARYPASRGPR